MVAALAGKRLTVAESAGRRGEGEGAAGGTGNAGLSVENEVVLAGEGGGYSVDILVQGGGLRGCHKGVVVEVDGPSHFLNPDRVLNGASQFKHRFLAAAGWGVVHVPYFEWQAQVGEAQRLGYIAGKLASHHPLY